METSLETPSLGTSIYCACSPKKKKKKRKKIQNNLFINRNKLTDFKTNHMVTISVTTGGREELGGWKQHIHTTV